RGAHAENDNNFDAEDAGMAGVPRTPQQHSLFFPWCSAVFQRTLRQGTCCSPRTSAASFLRVAFAVYETFPAWMLFATFSHSSSTRSRLPLQIFEISCSVYPRRTSSSVTLNVSAALFHPSTPPPPSMSELMPMWSIPISFFA